MQNHFSLKFTKIHQETKLIYSACTSAPTVGLHSEVFVDLFGILLFMLNERADYLIKGTWTGRQTHVLVCCHFHWQESRVINLSQ